MMIRERALSIGLIRALVPVRFADCPAAEEEAQEEEPRKEKKDKKAYADIDVAALLAGDEEAAAAPEPTPAAGVPLQCACCLLAGSWVTDWVLVQWGYALRLACCAAC